MNFSTSNDEEEQRALNKKIFDDIQAKIAGKKPWTDNEVLKQRKVNNSNNASKEKVTEKDDNDQTMLSQYDFEPVNYVQSISPVSVANLRNDHTPEYEQLITDGYETPRVFRQIVNGHSTPVKIKSGDYKLHKPPRDDEMWGNVKAIRPQFFN